MLVNIFNPHLGALTCLSTFEMLQAREHAPTRSLSIIFTFELTVESIKELGGVSIIGVETFA
jgi:hypothetical protein